MRFTEPREDYTHQHQSVKIMDGKQYGDLVEFVDFGYIANATRINLIALANLALAPAKPKDLKIVTGKLTNDTELRWAPSTEADVAGYEIVWRETTAPFWTNSAFVRRVPFEHGSDAGNTRKDTDPVSHVFKEMSKDNFFFGVRSVDLQGHKSPVVFPRPGR